MMKSKNNTAVKKSDMTDRKSPFGLIQLSRAGGIFAALMFIFTALPVVQAQPSITASQNPVLIPAGQTSGTTTLTWDGGPDHPYAEIWQQINAGDETFVVEQGKGTRQMTVEIGKTYIYKLSDFGTVLASVTVTAKNEPSNAPSSTNGGIATRPRPGNAYVAYVTDVKPEPGSSTVAITFWASTKASPIVEIGTTPPVQTNDRWVFPAGQSAGQGSAAASQKTGPLSKKVGVIANTFHKFDSSQSNLPRLEPGTHYWYIITGQNPGGQPNFFQTTGSFNTRSQTVKVVFTTVKITNDSDPDVEVPPFPRVPMAGEIDLWFWINHGDASAKGYAINNFNNGSVLSNHIYDINKEFVIENAPRILRLSISGSDNDAAHRVRNGNFVPHPLDGPQDTGLSEENVAKSEWDLTNFPTAPGTPFRQDFVIVSMPNGAGKGDLSFEVHGYFEIARPN